MPKLFDPSAGTVIRTPPGEGPGQWAGAPGVFLDEREGACYLSYRLRRPRGVEPDRGFEARIARSDDGVEFRDVFAASKAQFKSPSIEKCALIRDASGRWHYFVSYVDGGTGRWRIDRLEADAIKHLNPADRAPVLTGELLGLEGVKDPWVGRGGAGYVMLLSAAEAVPSTSPASHASADIYNTGQCLSVSCLATSPDLIAWTFEGVVFRPAAGQWDAYCARLNGAVRVGSAWWAPYDGAADVNENYEERCGLARSPDLRSWTRLFPTQPAVLSPHASGSVRYVVPIFRAGRLFVYYEFAREDGSHDLRVVSRGLPFGLA